MFERRRQRADRHGQAEILGWRLDIVDAEIVQETEGRIQTDLLEQIGRRHVARIGQGLARQQRSEERAVRVVHARRAFRQIGENVGRLDHAALERQRVDERLERRARRTLDARIVIRACAEIRIIDRSQLREHAVRRAIDDQYGGLLRAGVAPRRQIFARQSMRLLLKREIDRRAHARIVRAVGRYAAFAHHPFIE